MIPFILLFYDFKQLWGTLKGNCDRCGTLSHPHVPWTPHGLRMCWNWRPDKTLCCLSVCHICGLRRYIILLEVGGTARRGFAYSAKIFWLVLFALTILLTSGWRIFQIQFLVYDKDHKENLSCAVCLPTNMVNEENTEMMVSFKRCTPHAKKIPGAKICYCRFY